MLVGVNFSEVSYVFDFFMVVLPSGVCPDLTPEDREVKRRLALQKKIQIAREISLAI